MSATQTVETPAIEDTLFGDPEVTEVRADAGPDACFCRCACRTSQTKVNNALVASADTSVRK